MALKLYQGCLNEHMKTKVFLAATLGCVMMACNSREARFLNLSSGEEVDLTDNGDGQMVDARTGERVDYYYVDLDKGDTVDGRTGATLNGKLVRNTEGAWIVKGEGDEWKATNETTGAKIKTEDGDYKYKNGDYKRKVEADGDVKIEGNGKKIKIDGETGERKVKKDENLTKKVRDIFH